MGHAADGEPNEWHRKHYYTSVQGDASTVQDTADWLKGQGFEAPRVFKKSKTKGSKRVDISLATDMLLHASRKHYEIALLVTGDGDYVPLVRAVQLRHEADYFVDLTEYLL